MEIEIPQNLREKKTKSRNRREELGRLKLNNNSFWGKMGFEWFLGEYGVNREE